MDVSTIDFSQQQSINTIPSYIYIPLARVILEMYYGVGVFDPYPYQRSIHSAFLR